MDSGDRREQILIVDDTKLGRLSTRKLLEKFGFSRCEEASCGTDALQKIREGSFDAVFLDILMPDISGLEVLTQLKGMKPAIHVIIVSADIQKTTRERCLAAGARAFINKPIRGEDLQPVLQGLGLL